MNKLMHWILRFFVTSCFDNAIGEDNGGVVDVALDENTEKSPEEDGISTYLGSKEVNPEQRPLKNFDRTGMSKENIDMMVEAAGSEIMLSDETIAELAKKEKETDKKDETTSEDNDDDKKTDGDDSEDDPVKKFYEKSGITEEEFGALPEKVQEKVASLFDTPAEDDKSPEIIAAAQKKTAGLQKVIDAMLDNSTIAAAVEEMKTGKQYLAKELPAVTRAELKTLIEVSGNDEQFETAINELLVSKGESVIGAERSVAEKRFQVKQLEKDAMKIVLDIMKKEPRLATKETDLLKIDENHAEYDNLHGENGIMGILKRSGYSLKKIVDWGADRALNDISYARGWHNDKFKNAEKNGQKKLIEKIREQAKSAKGLDLTRKSAHTEPSKDGGYDRDSLVNSIASGDTDLWNKLIEEAGSNADAERVAELNIMYAEGLKKRKDKSI